MSKRRDGFTLVELLVVIGVIAVLISLLMPALQRARAAAQQIACMSNMRQQGQFIFMYAAESRGKLPYYRADGTGSTYQAFVRERVIKTANEANVSLGFPLPSSPLFRIMRTPGVLKCPAGLDYTAWDNNDPRFTPIRSRGRFRNASNVQVLVNQGSCLLAANVINSDNLRVLSDYTVNGINPSNWNDTTKVYNVTMTIGGRTIRYLPGFENNFNDPVSPCLRPRVSLSRVRNSANTWMGFEGAHWAQAGWEDVAFRHRGKSNFLYYDGHVESLASSEMDTATTGWGLSLPNTRILDERLFINR